MPRVGVLYSASDPTSGSELPGTTECSRIERVSSRGSWPNQRARDRARFVPEVPQKGGNRRPGAKLEFVCIFGHDAIVKPTALGPVANTDTKLLNYGLFQKGPSFGTGRGEHPLSCDSPGLDSEPLGWPLFRCHMVWRKRVLRNRDSRPKPKMRSVQLFKKASSTGVSLARSQTQTLSC